jgi:hypothetical protein
MSRDCFIYVMAASRDDGLGQPVKVGISADPVKRLASINTAAPFRVSIHRLFRMPSRFVACKIERAFHDRHRASRLNGEWFHLSPESAISSLALHFAVVYIEVMGRPKEKIQEWFDFIEMPEAVYVDKEQRCWGSGFAGELRE